MRHILGQQYIVALQISTSTPVFNPEAGNWQKAIHMESPINSDKLDYCPFIDIARNNFYFTSERLGETDHKLSSVKDLIEYANKSQNGMGDIYRIGLDEVMME